MIYSSWIKNPFSVLTRITSKEALMILSAIMDSSWEDSLPKRLRLVIHVPGAARANQRQNLGDPGVGAKEDTNNSRPTKPTL